MYKTIEKYPQFEINSKGEVRNKKTGSIIKMNTSKRTVRLCFDNKRIDLKVAITVASLFIPNPNNWLYVSYKDDNNLNVSADNLEWAPNSGYIPQRNIVEIGTTVHDFKILEEDYIFASHRKFKVECILCNKTSIKSFTELKTKSCSCTKETYHKPLKDKNKTLLKNGAKKLIKDIDYENKSMQLLCRNCRIVKEYSINHNKFYNSCCASSKPTRKNNKIKNERLRRIFGAMKDRCYNFKSKHFKNYGERGIKICDEWMESSQSFYKWAVENGYNNKLSIDRINNDGNYEPSNCRWIPLNINCKMNRHTVASFEMANFIREHSDVYSKKELSEICKVSLSVVKNIILEKTWVFEQKNIDKYLKV